MKGSSAKRKTLENGKAWGAIPTESLPGGILIITVFDQEWKPLAGRITFVNNEDYLFKPEVKVINEGLVNAQKMILKIMFGIIGLLIYWFQSTMQN
jgi:hypothetical protein